MQRARNFIQKHWVILAIGAGVVLVLAVGLGMKYTWTFSSAADESENDRGVDRSVATLMSEGNVPEGTQTAAGSSEAVALNDQAAGRAAEIASMTLTAPSWIAIRDDKSILGASWFPAGATEGVVKLIRAMDGDNEYRAVIYIDDGDKKFEMREDTLVTDGTGAPIGDSFRTHWATPR